MHARKSDGADRGVVIVDMDGTIADASRREAKFLKRTKKDWPGFFRDMEHDPPIDGVLSHVHEMQELHEIVILTGRPEKYRPQTERWLKKHKVKYATLLMRRHGDKRPDYEAKAALLDELKGRKIILALDDRGPVCAAYRKRGIQCIQVASDEMNQLVNETYRQKAD
jgi:FMN phosphatase YigB (HAD superfamily)